VLLPWVALYEFTAWLRLPGTAFRFGFEDALPVYPWTGLIYQSIYVVVAAAPWLARTKRDLRRLTISAWLAEALVFPFYWLVPSTAPRRPTEGGGWIGRLLAWERDGIPPTAAFPSFHLLWAIFLARVIRPAWLGAAYAVSILVSCITTGMHYLPDLLAALVIAPVFLWPPRLARLLRRLRLRGEQRG
jgi:hypothetical protein